jgi:hypothetical protein
VLAACGGGTAAGSQPPVTDHVHGVVAGSGSTQILLATHYGLEQSEDAGATWQVDNGLGEEMVAGIVKLPSDYVASLQPMAGMKMPRMTAANMSTPGMSMGAASTPNIGYSTNTDRWYSAQGIPPGAAVAALAGGSNASTVWASLIGFGIYESTDAGRSWQRVIPATVPVSDLLVVGANLLFVTPSGLFVTDVTDPSMPGLPELSQPVNDMTTLPNCGSCVVAALGSGGVAASRDGGVTWRQFADSPTFDELSAPPATSALFGMVPSSADPNHGVWRSTDGGTTWTKVLTVPLVDHLYALPAEARSPLEILAFQWGINVFGSTDDGVTWSPVSHIPTP